MVKSGIPWPGPKLRGLVEYRDVLSREILATRVLTVFSVTSVKGVAASS